MSESVSCEDLIERMANIIRNHPKKGVKENPEYAYRYGIETGLKALAIKLGLDTELEEVLENE